MPKFIVQARETVFYWKEVEAESEDQIKQMIFDGEIAFDYGDITDGCDFEVQSIDEEKRYA